MLRSIILISAALISTTAFAQTFRTSDDGYAVFKPEITQDVVSVKMVYAEDRPALIKLHQSLGGVLVKEEGQAAYPKLKAFATYNIEAKTCTIYTIRINGITKKADIGHELLHCFHGRWHD